MLRDADLTMCSAKRQGNLVRVLFDESMHGKALADLQLRAELRAALKTGEFVLFYQPIIDLQEGSIMQSRGSFDGIILIVAISRNGTVSPARSAEIALQRKQLEIACAQRLIMHALLRESHYQLLFRLQVANHDRASAIRTYHQLKSALRRELGVPTRTRNDSTIRTGFEE